MHGPLHDNVRCRDDIARELLGAEPTDGTTSRLDTRDDDPGDGEDRSGDVDILTGDAA
ncbi:hypothetical protein [Halosegnis marinus]|uniref:Uncharacterized protein n=1 Tax=Halosegnis marinus TaxID=3034023 RepID=A0ABD5ZRQ2_9EURY|nr:hypothetical protein [Halosegnis sp. DT85]